MPDNQTKTPDRIPDPEEPTSNLHPHKMIRIMYLVAGMLSLGLAILGVILPGMPTTVFVIITAWCWAKGSESFHDWLLNHRLFGKLLKDWYERRAMPRKAKYLAWTMMTISCILLWYRLPSHLWWVGLTTDVVCLLTAIWMANLADA